MNDPACERTTCVSMSDEDANRRAWDALARSESQFARVATDEECAQPLLALDRRGWLPGSIAGLDVLCLASGGGWQSILYAVAGARVTVVDVSSEMLRRDARQAERRNVHVRIVQGSMDDLSEFADESFDLVHHPVSSCYIRRLGDVYREVARVLRPDGLYISQHKQPTCLQVTERDPYDRYVIGLPYYLTDPLPAVQDTSYREPGAVEFLHRWEDLVGELCRSGFVIEDLSEPRRGDAKARPGDFRHRGMFVAPFVRIKARRRTVTPDISGAVRIWTPSE